MSFQDNLKKYRLAAGYTSATDFAKAIQSDIESTANKKFPYTTYLNYENKGTEPKFDVLCKIAQKLGISTDALLGNNVDNKYNGLFAALKRINMSFEIHNNNGCLSFNNKNYSLPVKFLDDLNNHFIKIQKNAYDSADKLVDFGIQSYVLGFLVATNNIVDSADFENLYASAMPSIPTNLIKQLASFTFKYKDNSDAIDFLISELKKDDLKE